MEELNLKRLEKIAESLLFAAGEPVSLDSIARVLGQNPSTARKIVSQLKDYYDREERGMQILEIENSYQVTSRPDYYTHIKLLYRSGQKITLTETQLETLAIIAYRQPVTKQEVEEIRGVRSDNIINRLIDFNLVVEKGRLKAPGRPILFGTTDEFLRYFGFRSIRDLPYLQNAEQLEEGDLPKDFFQVSNEDEE